MNLVDRDNSREVANGLKRSVIIGIFEGERLPIVDSNRAFLFFTRVFDRFTFDHAFFTLLVCFYTR